MNPKRLQVIGRVVIAVTVLLFFAWIAEQNLSLSGKKTITYHFNNTPNAIVGFWPERVQIKIQNNKSFGVPDKDTIYFDVKTPVLYKLATITLNGDHLEGSSIGVRTPPTIWTFRTMPITQEGQVALDLSSSTRTNSKYTFAIFLNQPAESVTLTNMTITLEKDRISTSKIVQKLQDLWKK